MQIDDYILHSLMPPLHLRHYWRQGFTDYRGPDNMSWIPALLEHGYRNYPYFENDLIPAGMVDNTAYSDFSNDAALGGWRSTEHSDCKNLPLYKVSTWYKETVWDMLDNWGMGR
jgi:hypothetical protein